MNTHTENSEGGFAFPCSGTEGVNPESLGMTLRDYFAAHSPMTRNTNYYDESGFKEAAKKAYKWADAMMAEKQSIK